MKLVSIPGLALAWLVLALGTAKAADPLENILLQENGARVIGFSSEWGGWEAASMTPSLERIREGGLTVEDFVWCTADNAPFPHWVLIELPQPTWITTFVLNNALKEEPAYPGISARNVEIWGSADSPDQLAKLAAFELERNKNGQSVRIEPTQVRWLKFNVTSNWGHEVWTELNAAVALDDGSRPANFESDLLANGKVDLYGIYFDFASAMLREESAPALAQVLAFHRAHPDRELVIEGHTDNVGSDGYNKDLSLRRAKAVVAALTRMGAAEPQFEAQGLGAAQPVADNASDGGRAKNRRVTVRVP